MNEPASVSCWSFPRHRPQMFAPTSAALRAVHPLYAFGRDIPGPIRGALALVVATPVLRQLVAGRAEVALPFGSEVFRQIEDRISATVQHSSWAIFKSAWQTKRLLLFSFDGRNQCTGVSHIGPSTQATFHPRGQDAFVSVPRVLDEWVVAGWYVRTVEPLPPWHRAFPWDIDRLQEVIDEASSIVGSHLGRPPAIPPDWVPIHGDLTPWNLRVGEDERVWLLDWEWAGWGPPQADLLRFALTHSAMSMDDADTMLAWITTHLPADKGALAGAASYWLDHRMYRGADADPSDGSEEGGLGPERAKNQTEHIVLEALAARG